MNAPATALVRLGGRPFREGGGGPLEKGVRKFVVVNVKKSVEKIRTVNFGALTNVLSQSLPTFLIFSRLFSPLACIAIESLRFGFKRQTPRSDKFYAVRQWSVN